MSKKEINLSISIVVYKDPPELLKKLLNCLSATRLKTKIFVIDNSPTRELEEVCASSIVYLFNNKNKGFGAAHNIAIKKMAGISEYHLILNPDIYFKTGTLESLYDFMENNKDVGLAMPKILYPDGSLQYLCHLLPNPADLFIRRFFNRPLLNVFVKRQNLEYELKFADYNKIMEVPYLSGCFMFIRNNVFENIGMFDEKFFIYLEDVDLSRRIKKYYRTVYYPFALVVHEYRKGSYKDFNLFIHHLFSAIIYFNKWGWFFDKERRIINKNTLKKLKADV